jgi:hypothetical protein
VRLFRSYREAELHGYYSLKRLRQTGLEVRERERWNYLYVVATPYGNLPVYSKEQARDSRAADPVPGPSEPKSLDPIGVEVLLPEEESTANVQAALCGQNCPPTGSSRQTGPTEKKRRTRGRAKPRSTGYFIDTPEDLDVPDSHKDAENEIRLILHVVKSGIDRHGHQVEGVAHYNHPLGKKLMGSPLEQKAYKWLIDNDVLICADHSYSHRPGDPKSSFSKSYYVHSRHGKWRNWEITKSRLAAKLLLAQSQRTDLKSPKRRTDTEQTTNVHVALCGQNCPVQELLTITDPVMDHLVRQNLDLGIDMDKAWRIMDEHSKANRKKAMATARKVGDPKASYKVCDYGRFHAPITRLFSPLREAVFFKSRPDARKVGWDLRNSQILHLVKAYKEDRYEARAGSRSAEPFFNEREEEFFRLVEQGQVYDSCFAKAQQDCPEYLVAKVRRTKQKAAWADLWKEYLEGLPAGERPKDVGQQQAHRRKLLRKHPIKSISVQVHDPTRDDFKQVLFADVFYGRAVVGTPVTRLFETDHPEILQWIRTQKAHDYADLARRMQREESGMMIGAVVRRLMEHHPEVPFYTVHDSITTTAEYGDLVGRILKEEYGRAGLHPALKQTGDDPP